MGHLGSKGVDYSPCIVKSRRKCESSGSYDQVEDVNEPREPRVLDGRVLGSGRRHPDPDRVLVRQQKGGRRAD